MSRRSLRILLVVGLLVNFAVLGFLMVRTINQASEGHRALCTLKQDFQARVDSGYAFLAKNPNGIPGVPVELLKTQLDNQQRTVAALHDIECKENEK